jgi:hypothetical protein
MCQKIVVTKEMLQAGVREFFACHSLEYETPGDAVMSILTAVLSTQWSCPS